MHAIRRISTLVVVSLVVAAACFYDKLWEAAEVGDYVFVKNRGGKDIACSVNSGIGIITDRGFAFKDLNRGGKLDRYEDLRLSPDERAKDLASKMSIDEIAGLMLYSGHQSVPAMSSRFAANTYGGLPYAGSGADPWELSDQQRRFLVNDNLRHLLITFVQSPEVAARWNNNLQALVEGIGYGIPANNSSDPRHGTIAGAEYDAGAGGSISMLPGSLGLAATFDPDLVYNFGQIASREYRALGITTALSPQVDLATDPRWGRVNGTFGVEGGACPASALMPYYTISYDQDTVYGENVGNAYSKYIITDLLREKYGYDGVVCTDWGVTRSATAVDQFGNAAWGVEGLSEAERHYKAIMAGVDQFGGNSDAGPVIEAYYMGAAIHGEDFMRKRFEKSAKRLLRNIFRTGLFENPYLDIENSVAVAGNAGFMEAGFNAQLRSVVLLKNAGNTLPADTRKRVYIPMIPELRTMLLSSLKVHVPETVTAGMN